MSDTEREREREVRAQERESARERERIYLPEHTNCIPSYMDVRTTLL